MLNIEKISIPTAGPTLSRITKKEIINYAAFISPREESPKPPAGTPAAGPP